MMEHITPTNNFLQLIFFSHPIVWSFVLLFFLSIPWTLPWKIRTLEVPMFLCNEPEKPTTGPTGTYSAAVRAAARTADRAGAGSCCDVICAEERHRSRHRSSQKLRQQDKLPRPVMEDFLQAAWIKKMKLKLFYAVFLFSFVLFCVVRVLELLVFVFIYVLQLIKNEKKN